MLPLGFTLLGLQNICQHFYFILKNATSDYLMRWQGWRTILTVKNIIGRFLKRKNSTGTKMKPNGTKWVVFSFIFYQTAFFDTLTHVISCQQGYFWNLEESISQLPVLRKIVILRKLLENIRNRRRYKCSLYLEAYRFYSCVLQVQGNEVLVNVKAGKHHTPLDYTLPPPPPLGTVFAVWASISSV